MLKKKTLKILYMNIKAALSLMALFIFKRYMLFSDNHFLIKFVIYTTVVLAVFGITHYIFMRYDSMKGQG